ncbi:MAG: peptidylprolyl isomerase [Myxococcota bacterium]|nr:peptidylprolyl isomerase [Myxococcota bacterium]
MIMRYLLAVGAILFVTIVPAVNAKSDEDKGNEASRLDLPLARIDGKPLTVFYFERAATGLTEAGGERLFNEKGRVDFLHELIDTELQAQEAARRGYDTHEDVQDALKESLAHAMEIYLRLNIEAREPTEADLQRYYEAHAETFNVKEMIRARHILVRNKTAAEKLLYSVLKAQPSQRVFERLKGGTGDRAFNSLDLGFLAKPSEADDPVLPMMAAMAAAAFTLKKDGDIYPELIQSKNGYHILMRTGYRPGTHISYEEAKTRGLYSTVKYYLMMKKLDERVAALKDRFAVVVYEETLKEIAF